MILGRASVFESEVAYPCDTHNRHLRREDHQLLESVRRSSKSRHAAVQRNCIEGNALVPCQSYILIRMVCRCPSVH